MSVSICVAVNLHLLHRFVLQVVLKQGVLIAPCPVKPVQALLAMFVRVLRWQARCGPHDGEASLQITQHQVAEHRRAVAARWQ